MASGLVDEEEDVHSFDLSRSGCHGPVAVLLVVLRLDQVLQFAEDLLIFGLSHHFDVVVLE